MASNAEVTKTIQRRQVDVVDLQEMRQRNGRAAKLRGGDLKYKFGKEKKPDMGSVGLLVKQKLVESVLEVTRVNLQILCVVVVLREKVVTIILVYGPQSGGNLKEEEKLYDGLKDEVQSRNKNCFVLRHFNGYGESSVCDCDEVCEGIEITKKVLRVCGQF